ncbi:adenylosuccinate synthetase [Chitinilyticum piscinae]|uniref:Adenylosuccinate synthetase n=1 Tax=Chitinilyticum piscinae TaxID=2866724 RepID=A0A8J7G205_9NEIS|nr:adenylosuccinate synthetase [Chitinilyticum piscinae]MBE9610520.1 adenylosuccinate synthetase [Chitinilyticum piscinae]
MAERVTPRLLTVFGLGFGDCGKGRFVDALAARLDAHTVVRYNGGGQAGHTVVLDDGRSHIFAQFAAASFLPGVHTVLAAPFVLHPGGLLHEAALLAGKHCPPLWPRLLIDAACRVTTPWLQAAGRWRELRRGAAAHGSCGIGFGATVELSLTQPDASLSYGELLDSTVTLAKLQRQRELLQDEFAGDERFATELAALLDIALPRRWLRQVRELLALSPPASPAHISRQLQRPGHVIFEGAQGMLLDEHYGFHPHTTWSSTGPQAAAQVARHYGLDEPHAHYGALRSYLTRHGAGPLPSEDPALDVLAEPHNADTGWQGRFRRGHFDAVLLRYALACAGTIDGLLLSHADALGRATINWCDAYEIDGQRQQTLAIPASLKEQEGLTSQLGTARTICTQRLSSLGQLTQQLNTTCGLDSIASSHGPQRSAIFWRPS